MKKPVNEIERVRGFYSRGDFWDDSVRVVLDFLGALPDEFEIVPEGYSVVKWPEGLNRERIIWLLQHPFSAHFGELHGLAKIAPSMKKPRRMAELWLHVSGQKLWKFPDDNWRLNATDWRKVGECEVDE